MNYIGTSTVKTGELTIPTHGIHTDLVINHKAESYPNQAPSTDDRGSRIMQITVSLHGVFRIDRFKLKTLTYPDGSRVQKVIDDLQIPATLLGTILINKAHAKSTEILHDGDTLMILPLLEGG
jgi:hypothetical protein